MQRDSSIQRKTGIVLQYVQMSLNILIQLLYTPVMLRILGQNEYGIYNLAASSISYLSLLSLGLGASYIRWYSNYKKDNDYDSINKLNGLYLIVFTVIGLLALILGFILTANVQWFFNDTYSTNDIRVACVLMFFLSINMAFSFPFSVFISYISSQEKFIFQKTINIGSTVICPLINLVLLYNGLGSVGMVITTTVVSLVTGAINIYYCLAKLHMKLSFRSPKILLLKDIFVFSIFIAINQIIDQINWQTDKIVLGKVVNGAAVAVYAIGAQINNMFTNFSTAISGVYAPKVNMIVSKNEDDMDEKLTDLLIRVGRVQWFVLALILLGFVFFGKVFVINWAGPKYETSYYVALLLMVPAIIPLIQNIGIEIQRAKYKHKFRSIAYLIMAALNVLISIWFASMWKEIGAALGTTISLILANGFAMNIYYHRKCGLDICRFWKSIVKTLPGFIAPVILGICLNMLYSYKSYVDYVLMIVLYVIVYTASIYTFSFNNDEKEMSKSIGSRITRR